MLIAQEYLGKVGVGVTVPLFFRAHDGNKYVVKFHNNPISCRVLISELFAAKLGKIIGLCFPTSDLIVIKDPIIRSNHELLTLGVKPGLHFASSFLDGAEYVGKNRLHKVANVSDMAGVVLFDHIFHNADRAKNQKNLLLREEDSSYRIYAIDNSHLFKTSHWTQETFQKLGTKIKVYHFQHYRALLNDHLNATDFLHYKDKMKNITEQTIDDIIKEIPLEWLPEDRDRLAFSSYVKIRLTMIEEIWTKISLYIPQSRGGKRWLFAN